VSGWRPLALVALIVVAGALGTLGAGLAVGMDAGELTHLGVLLVPAIAATILSAALARSLLSRAPIRHGLVAIAVLAVAVGLTNLFVLARLMIVDAHEGILVAVLLVYALGAGVGAALAIGRSHARALDRVAATARAIGSGEPGIRTGRLGSGPEIETLARVLDRMAADLEAARAREEEVEASRRDLVTAISHDLRTPLASLQAMVEAVDDGVVDDGPTLRRYAAEMRRSVGTLAALVDDLFELSQLEAGAMELAGQEVRLRDVVHRAVAAVEAQARSKSLALAMDLDGAGDQPCSPHLARVLQNLLQNAVRHTPADGTVRVQARWRPEALELAVEDTGEGIPAEKLPLVFDPFWRGDTARGGDGSGLGLAVAKRIAEALGGTIEATSSLARGSRFAIVLPR
jgi:signal transduction histidine kinase